MQFNSIHHVAIICSDYNKSKHFYSKILGFQIINETYREKRDSYKLDLVNNNIRIELFSFNQPPKRTSRPEACGLRHLAFGVDNILKAIDYLLQHDIICEEIRVDESTGKKFTFFSDPDELPLELYEN